MDRHSRSNKRHGGWKKEKKASQKEAQKFKAQKKNKKGEGGDEEVKQKRARNFCVTEIKWLRREEKDTRKRGKKSTQRDTKKRPEEKREETR